MPYSLAAHAVAITHLAFIVFVVLGGLLVLRWPKMIWMHMPAAIWGALIEFNNWYCPLTGWENQLLRRAGEAGYDNGFIEHYIYGLIYPAGLTRNTQLVLGLSVILINLAVYGTVVHRRLTSPAAPRVKPPLPRRP